jgi:chromosome segregation ATPase
MDGGQDATQTEGQQQEQQGGQAQQEAGQDAKTNQPEAVGSAAEWRKALAAKDAQIAELQGKVTAAAKTAEATEALNAEIAQLKQQMADERTEFALRAAGARSVKAAKALLSEHDGDIQALVAAEPWLFENATSQRTSQAGGTTGLEPAGVSGGSDAACMRRWATIAGLDEKE